MRRRRCEEGISLMEYAALYAVLVAALIAMAPFVKRAVAGSFRASADTFGRGRQYEPGVTKVFVTGCGRADLPPCH